MGKAINPGGIETKFMTTLNRISDENVKHDDDNHEDENVAKSLDVTDGINCKDTTKYNFQVIHNEQEKKEIQDNPEEISEDKESSGHFSEPKKNIELHEYKIEEDHEIVIHKQNVAGVKIYEAERKHPTANENTGSVEMANSYRGSFSQDSDLSEIAGLEYEEVAPISNDGTSTDAKEIQHSSPRYLDISHKKIMKETLSNLDEGRDSEKVKDDRVESTEANIGSASNHFFDLH